MYRQVDRLTLDRHSLLISSVAIEYEAEQAGMPRGDEVVNAEIGW